MTITPEIQGEGGLLKIGAGTLTLGGLGDYTGGTTVQTGTLALAGAEALADGGDLMIEGTGRVALGTIPEIAPGSVAMGRATLSAAHAVPEPSTLALLAIAFAALALRLGRRKWNTN